ncbi:transcriptional regulator, partial [mine drainage metagenome]
AFLPFYYGLEDALSLRGFWEQETNPVIITPRKVRNGVRQFDSRNYVVRRIDRKMFFGYTFVNYEEFYIPVSDTEKTLIDLIILTLRYQTKSSTHWS